MCPGVSIKRRQDSVFSFECERIVATGGFLGRREHSSWGVPWRATCCCDATSTAFGVERCPSLFYLGSKRTALLPPGRMDAERYRGKRRPYRVV